MASVNTPLPQETDETLLETTDQQKTKEPNVTQRGMSYVETADTFFADFQQNEDMEIRPRQKNGSVRTAQSPVQNISHVVLQTNVSPEMIAALQSIQGLQQGVREELSILRDEVRSLQRTSSANNKNIEQMRKPLWEKIWNIFSAPNQGRGTRSSRETTRRLYAEPLGSRDNLSTFLPLLPEPPLAGFEDTSAIVGTPDTTQPNIMTVKREGRTSASQGFGTTEMKDNWFASSILNGQEQALPFNYRRDAPPDIRNVSPKLSFEPVGNGAIQITWENIQPGYRANIGGFYDQQLPNTDGSIVIGIPWTMYDQGFQIAFRRPDNTILPNSFFCKIRGGEYYNSYPNPYSTTYSNLSWQRSFRPADSKLTIQKNLQSVDSTLPDGTLFKAGEVVLNPDVNEAAALTWTSHATGNVEISGSLKDKKVGRGDGVTYTIAIVNTDGSQNVVRTGVIADGGNVVIAKGELIVPMTAGQKLKLIISPEGTSNNSSNSEWDTIGIAMEAKLTEAEKTYERVTVAPSIALRAREDNRAVFIDYRNMPAGISVRAVARDHYQTSRQLVLPQGTGSTWINLNNFPYGTQCAIDLYIVDGLNDNQPLEEKKLTLTAEVGPDNPFIMEVPSERKYFGSLAHDVLKEPNLQRTEADFAEELSVSAYLQYKMNPPARDWTDGKVFNHLDKAHQFGALRQIDLMNEPLNGHGEQYKIVIPTSTTGFERHSFITDGSVNIERVLYVKEDGLHVLPREYYERLPNGDLITKETGPGFIVLEMRLYGHFNRAAAQAETLAEVLPLEGQHVIGGIERITPQPTDQPGWRDMVLDIQQGPSAVLNPGSTDCVFAQLHGIGTEGGIITLRTYCTYDGNITNVQPQYVSTINLGATQQKAVYFNASAPLPGPSSDARGIITMEIEYADHRREILARRLTRSLGYDEVEQAAESARRAKIYAGLPMLAADGKTVIGMGGNLFKDQRSIAENFLNSFGLNMNPQSMDLALAVLERNGTESETWAMFSNLYQAVDPASFNAVSALRDTQSWYSDSNPTNPVIMIGGTNVRKDSMVGRIFMGLYQKTLASSHKDRMQMFAKVEQVTGISRMYLMGISQRNDFETFQEGLMGLFEDNGYGFIFEESPTGPFERSEDMQNIKTSTNDTDYENGRIIVTWDLPASMNVDDLLRTDIYLMRHADNDYQQIGGYYADPLKRQGAGFFSASIPVEEAGAIFHDTMALKVVIWRNAQGSNNQNLNKFGYTNDFSLDWDGTYDEESYSQLLSTVPDEMREQVLADIGINTVDVPEANRLILEYFKSQFLQSGALKYDTQGWMYGRNYELESVTPRNTGNAECKEWLQQTLVWQATNGRVHLPNNTDVVTSKWVMNTPNSSGQILSADGTVLQVAEMNAQGEFSNMIDVSNTNRIIKPGDIVQMKYRTIGHTMVIAKIESDGIWVFDTNFGPKVNNLADNTTRYKFMSYDELNSNVFSATIYRGIIPTIV